MRIRTFQELQRDYLIKLYELTDGAAFKQINNSTLRNALGISEQDESELINYLKYPNFIDGTFGTVMLTPTGKMIAEGYMKEDYADKELLILQTADEMGKTSSGGIVIIFDLARELNMPVHDLIDYLDELENRKYWIKSVADEAIKVSPRGKEFLQKKSNMPKATGDNYNTHNYGNAINQIGGSNNTQYAQMNLNPEFEKLITPVLDLIRSSELPQPDKDEFIQDIQTVNRLIAENPERAKAKFDYLGTALKATDIGLKLAPYIPAITAFIESHIK